MSIDSNLPAAFDTQSKEAVIKAHSSGTSWEADVPVDPVNILIVDDEPKNLVVLETILEDPHYRLVKATSVDQALRALIIEEFALVILDVQLPEMTGFELAQMIRQRKKTAQLPIIFLTAYYHEDQDVLQGYGTGAVDYLFKPVKPAILRSKVAVFADLCRKSRTLHAEVVERRRAEEQLRELNEALAQSKNRLLALTAELNLSEQRERKRLATELHDHLQQTLVLGKIKLGQGKHLTEALPACATLMKDMDDVLSEALKYTRTLVTELSPHVLYEHGLIAGLKWLSESMKKHGLSVTMTLISKEEPKLPENQAVLLFQSVRELLINSSKYAGTGQAEITLEYHDGQLIIVVRDEGAGFDFAAANSPTDGLSSKFGLFSIRERMKTLGGRFDIQSSTGVGTTATLVLPFARRVEPKISQISGRNAVEGSLEHFTMHQQDSKIRVLLVDDHAMVREGLRSVLERYADIEVVGEASDGQQAVISATRLQPSIVVMDINMPTMNGIEATKSIRTRFPRILVIGLSVNVGDENQLAMKAAGATTLLTKESAVEHLYGAILQAIESRPARKPVNEAQDEMAANPTS